jgi:MFS family permease
MQATTIATQEPLSKVRLKIISFVTFTFIGYFTIGLPLAVLPIFINQQLGYSTMIAGIVISLQYVTTFLSRGYTGSIVDKKGPKPAVILGMVGFTLSGILLLAAYWLKSTPTLSLSVLIVTRFMTGFSEGLIGASPINWAILAVGNTYTSKAISFNGVASYGALAVGAPLGVILQNSYGIGSIAILTLFMGLIGLIYAKSKTALGGSSTAVRQPFLKVLKTVSPFGICLALGGLGFGTISTFITLYYAYLNWQGAVLCLSVFSILFVMGRVLFSKYIDVYGGMPTAIVCLSLEAIGLFILWQAPIPHIALVGSGITGLGFSLVFPALGVEAVKLVPATNQGSALGNYGLFTDISLGLTGPLVGAVATHMGMQYIFPFSMAMALVGVILAVLLYRKHQVTLADNSVANQLS